jgi:hypothetical protein
MRAGGEYDFGAIAWFYKMGAEILHVMQADSSFDVPFLRKMS